MRDEATGAPLSGARISVEGAFESAASTFPVLSEATSGADGRFSLASLPSRASLFVAAAGHHARASSGSMRPWRERHDCGGTAPAHRRG